MAQTQFRSMAKPRRKKIDRLTLILAALFLIVAVITAFVAFSMVKNIVLSWTMTPIDGINVPNPSQPTQVNNQGTPIPADVPLQSSSGPAAQPWDGTSRVTILIIGLDYRDWEAGGPPRSDTMMLLTLDPLSKTAGMLSVPRDMWVNIPQVNTYAKINEAYRYGEAYNSAWRRTRPGYRDRAQFSGRPDQLLRPDRFLRL